jgi:DNA-binding beta-propeller fold protein YncE
MAPEEMPEVVETPEESGLDLGDLPRRNDPRQLTTREKRRRWILLTILALLLALLSYLAYYFAMNRRLPGLELAPVATDFIPPPIYLYSISGKDAASLVRPVGLGVADDGRVYVVDFGHSRVSVFTNAGRYLFSFNKTADGTLKSPVHLAVKGNEVWVSERAFDAIYIFDLQGKYLRKFIPKNEKPKATWKPLAFSFDSSGALRATDVGDTRRHRLVYFSEDGSRTAAVGKTAQVNTPQDQPGSFLFPNGVAVAANGDVIVSDGDNRRVQVFSPQGEFLRFVNTSGVPRGIAIDQKQRLYVADALAHTISVFDQKGTTLTQFGERGFGPGQFNYPNDIAIDKRGRIYITDRENNQVQVWGWPVAAVPQLPLPKSPLAWLAALACCIPLILLPLILLARRKVRIIVSPEFIDALERAGEMKPTSEKARVRLIAPEEDRALYEGRVVDGIDLGQLLTFDDYSEADARALIDRLRVSQRQAMLLSMAWRAKALGTDDRDLRLLALVAEVRTIDAAEFREIYLGRDRAAGPERPEGGSSE